MACGALLLGTACQGATNEISDEDKKAAKSRLRPAATNEERNDFVQRCLEQNAVTVYTRTPDGLFTGSGVTERDQLVLRNCIEEGLDEFPPGSQPSTAAEHAVFYELYQRQTECLEELGIDVEEPSLDSYIDSDGEWSPYVDVDPSSLPGNLTWADVNNLCPQDPWQYG